MTATATEITIPAALPHQEPIVQSPARFKVVRAGRRGGKTVLAEHCAVVGHGPEQPDGTPMFKAIAHGLDVVWVARDYTQSRIMWHEFVEPRFRNKEGVKVNGSEMTVTILGAGTLFIVSAENIASVRGIGARLAGAVVEEAAWLALGNALRDVILPALMDNEGWLLLISTTNAGPDGGLTEDGSPQIPSYFNQLCAEIRDGKRSAEWAEFHFTARHNPKITERAFQSLVAEYVTPDSPSLKQEVYAELLEVGAGLVLPGLCERHFVTAFHPPSHWQRWLAFDWGYQHPWSLGIYTIDADGQVYKCETLTGRLDLPEQIHAAVRDAGIDPSTLITYAGADIWQSRADRKSAGPTIAEALMELGWVLLPANNSRILGLNNLRRYTYLDPAKPNAAPRFQWMDTSGNRACFNQVKRMTIDPKRVEDALKVDADSAGRGGDDMYDETRYGLMVYPVPTERIADKRDQDNQHPGFDYERRTVREEHSEPVSQRPGFRNPMTWKVPK